MGKVSGILSLLEDSSPLLVRMQRDVDALQYQLQRYITPNGQLQNTPEALQLLSNLDHKKHQMLQLKSKVYNTRKEAPKNVQRNKQGLMASTGVAALGAGAMSQDADAGTVSSILNRIVKNADRLVTHTSKPTRVEKHQWSGRIEDHPDYPFNSEDHNGYMLPSVEDLKNQSSLPPTKKGKPEIPFAVAGAVGAGSLLSSDEADAGWDRMLRELMIKIQRNKDTYNARFSDAGNSIPARKLMQLIDEDEAKLARLQKQGAPTPVSPTVQSPEDEAAYLREMINRRSQSQVVSDPLEGQLYDQMELFPRSPFPVRYP